MAPATAGAHEIGQTHDAAPTKAGAVPGTSLPSDHACIFSTCWPRLNLDRNYPSGMGDRRVGT
jgi:hypothetical protein